MAAGWLGWREALVVVVAVVLVGCGGGDAAVDAGSDGGGAQVDGGADAGVWDGGADAGASDAGVADGGSDGGAADAGPDCTGLPDGTSCGTLMICLSGSCAVSLCGDGFVDTDAGEECEDGNSTPGDGCEPTCEWTCTSDEDCDDADVCTGDEVCRVDHTCSNPADLDCDDADPCTSDSCDAVSGCSSSLIDADGDGFAPSSLGSCAAGTAGGDCNDSDSTVFPGAYDGCDGASVDNDCDGAVDEDEISRWYIDCDGDGYAASTTGSVEACDVPTGGTGCGGSWTSVAPSLPRFTDCDDGLGSVFPGATEVVGNGRDDDCNGSESCYRDRDGDGYRTDETISSSDADCSDSGEALASRPLEWASASARDVCCDQDSSVHAGQTSWFSSDETSGNLACPSGRRWDYDCDGSEERRWTSTLWVCGYDVGTGACGTRSSASGWFTTGSAPPCGSPHASWASNCHPSGSLSCAFDLSSRAQDCH